MRRKITALLLVVTMVLTLMPATSMAASKKLTLKKSTVTTTSVKLTWNKVSKATKYVIYGNKSGKTLKKIATVKSGKKRAYTVKKIGDTLLKEDTQYKFSVNAYSKKGLIAKSNTIKTKIKTAEKKPEEEKKKEEEEKQEESFEQKLSDALSKTAELIAQINELINKEEKDDPTPGPTPQEDVEKAKKEAQDKLAEELKNISGQSDAVKTIAAQIEADIEKATTEREIVIALAEGLDKINNQVEIEYIGDSGLKRIGGRIFYVGADNGLTYEFYDAGMQIITNWNVGANGYPSGLEAARYYKITGGTSNGNDRFYVYATKDGVTEYGGIYKYQDDPRHTIDGVEWGAKGTLIGNTFEDVGGRENSSKALKNDDSFKATYEDYETVWTWLKRMNDNNFNLCNDWFIGSKNEHNLLIETKIEEEFYSAHKVWTSTEYDKDWSIQAIVKYDTKVIWNAETEQSEKVTERKLLWATNAKDSGLISVTGTKATAIAFRSF